MELVRAGFNSGIQNGGAGTSELGTEVSGLDFEFLNRIDRRENDKVGAVQEVDRVGIVVNAIEHVVVLRRTKAIRREAPVAALPRVSACGEFTPAESCARKVKFRPFRGKVVNAVRINHLADGSVLGLQHRGGGRDFHRFGRTARCQREINHDIRTHVDRDLMSYGSCLEPLGEDADLP